MAGFMDNYQTVQERIDIFWRLYPDGRYSSEIVAVTEKEIIVKASVWVDRSHVAPTCVDFAQESVIAEGKMAGMHVELAVTSALGRAISQLGGELSPDKRKASQTEMEKSQRVLAAKVLNEAQKAFERADVDTLRELYTEAKEYKLEPSVVAKVLSLGSEVAQKLKNASVGKEIETTEAQA
jgi:hypothetical protein